MRTKTVLVRKYLKEFDMEIYTDKIGDSGRRVIRKAYDEARARGHNQLAPEHILVSIAKLEKDLFNDVMQRLKVDPISVQQEVESKLSEDDYRGRGIKISESLRVLLSVGLSRARRRGRGQIESSDLFIAIFEEPESTAVQVIKGLGLGREDVIGKIEDAMKE